VNWIDAAIVIVWLFFVVTSFQNGLVREIIGLGSVLAGVILAGLFYQDFSDALLDSIDNETTKQMVAFTVIFVSTAVLGQLIAMLVHPAIALMQLGVADQLAGAAFGAIKGWVIITGLLILLVTYPVYDMDEKIADSEFADLLLESATPILRLLPDEFENAVDAFTAGGINPSIRPERDPLGQ
jgi:membrane protein required for colicin V production